MVGVSYLFTYRLAVPARSIPGGIISIDANIHFVLKNVLVLLDLFCGPEAVERQMLSGASPGDGAATLSIHQKIFTILLGELRGQCTIKSWLAKECEPFVLLTAASNLGALRLVAA